eukprot:m.228479 g.228479  ORF g.228479 m.228479 type:complete len:230 (+) comp18829_c0_seq4:381-1070(+)
MQRSLTAPQQTTCATATSVRHCPPVTVPAALASHCCVSTGWVARIGLRGLMLLEAHIAHAHIPQNAVGAAVITNTSPAFSAMMAASKQAKISRATLTRRGVCVLGPLCTGEELDTGRHGVVASSRERHVVCLWSCVCTARDICLDDCPDEGTRWLVTTLRAFAPWRPSTGSVGRLDCQTTGKLDWRHDGNVCCAAGAGCLVHADGPERSSNQLGTNFVITRVQLFVVPS